MLANLARRPLSLLVTLLFVFGCASKTSRHGNPVTVSPEQPTSVDQPKDKGSEIGPQPEGPKQGPPEPPHIALVLGGAGVASFATVGLLKRFGEEGIRVDYIVSTGWPTLFALAYGFFRSIHDVEWFAMRLAEKDFYNAGIFELSKDYESHERLSALIQSSFEQKDLSEAHVPIVISATNTDIGDPEIYDRGDWKEPLLKTMSIPGIYRPYPQGDNQEWVHSLRGLDVEEAMHRGSRVIVAVEMYEDYFGYLRGSRKGNSDAVFRRLYLTQLRKTLQTSLKQAQLTAKIVLHKEPNDFSSKRLAILNGYKEAGRLAKELRQQYAR